MGKTNIQWCDYSWNPWIGCRKVAPECANCYAETLDRNRYSKTLAPGTKEKPVSHWGSGPRHRTKTWGDPLKWNITKYGAAPMICDCCGNLYGYPGACMHTDKLHRPRVFCASLADWLDDENVPIEWFADLLRLIHATPNLDWLALTKRPQNWRLRLAQAIVHHDATWNVMDYSPFRKFLKDWYHGYPPANVWIGVSAGADQAAALDIPARVHFLSCEPMLRPLEINETSARFSWVIFGGESGTKARQCNIDWIRSPLRQYRNAGIPVFVKQLGAKPVYTDWETKLDVPIKLEDSHGGEMDEWPSDLRLREFPTSK